MGSIVRHFYTSGDDTIRVLTRFENNEGRIGRTDERVTPADRYFGIPYDLLAAAGSGQIILAEDGTAAIRHVDDQHGETGDKTMSSVITTFEPGPGNTIRFFTHFEASGAEAAGHGQEDVAPQAEIFGIPWAEFIAAGFGIVDRPENGPATIRRFDNQPEDTETGQ